MAVSAITLRNYRSFGPSGARIDLAAQFFGVVGVNNSGKSSAVRALYELRPVFQNLASRAINDTDFLALFNAGSGLGGLQLANGERVTPTYNTSLKPRITIEFDHGASTSPQSIIELSFSLQMNGESLLEATLGDGRRFPTGVQGALIAFGPDQRTHLLHELNGVEYVLDWESVTEELRWLADSFYIGPFRNAINAGGGVYYDLQIGRSFIESFANQKSGFDASANEAVDAMTRELRSIFGFDQLEINPSPDHSALTLIIDGRSMRGSEVGAGLTQFVLVAASVLVRRPAILLIDEPELNLHASLQVRFLALLAQYVNGPVVFASHSLGLARSVADVLTVATRDAQSGIARLDDFQTAPNLPLTLGELGYSGQYDTAFKGVLLVEGVSEVRTFQELLAKWGLRNDLAVVQLGGDSMATGGRDQELLELRKLSTNVFAIVDSERGALSSPPIKARQDFAASCAAQGIDCTVLDRRATENYLSLDVAVEVMHLPSGTTLGECDSVPSSWNKQANWRVARRMNREDLDGTDLAAALDRIAAAIGSAA